MGKKSCSRRLFIKTGAAAVGMTVLSQSCERPVHKIIPALIQPEEVVPGMNMYYSSMYTNGSDCMPVVVKIAEGKPVKINGNHLCPLTQGFINAAAQSSLPELYHPERILRPVVHHEQKDKEEFNGAIQKKLKEIFDKEKFLYLITPSVISPSEQEIIRRFAKIYPNVKHFMIDCFSLSSLPDSYLIATGRRYIPYFRIDLSELLLSFNCDFLGGWLSPPLFSHQYNIACHSKHFRHIQFESHVSLSGTRAHERYPIKPSEETMILCSIYNTIAKIKGQCVINNGFELPDYSALACQLISKKALVVSGSNLLVNQLLVIAINHITGSYKHCIDLSRAVITRQGDDRSFFDMVSKSMDNVGGIIISGLDLISAFGHDEGIRQWFENIDFRLAGAMVPNKTTTLATHIFPLSHFLESWNDGMAVEGTVWLAQPLVKSSGHVQSLQEWMLNWMNDALDLKTLIKTKCIEKALLSEAKDKDQIWEKCLQQGFYQYETSVKKPHVDIQKVIDYIHLGSPSGIGQTTEIILIPSIHSLRDNPWIKELPHFITSQSWGISAMASPEWMKENNLSDGDYVFIDNRVVLPVLGIPGHAANCLSVELHEDEEINTFVLAGINNGTRTYTYMPATIQKIRPAAKIVVVQKKIITTRRFLFSHLLRPYNRKSGKGLYPEYAIESQRLGMIIDIDKCTGCGSCVISCQMENNIPPVGKDQVAKGRLMHWLRIDRYFIRENNTTSIVNIPVMCQHCYHAPCESVCPVSATTHSTDGINQMVYNRCIGTRFCANACPYKTRVYNWYDYTGTDPIPRNNRYADERWVVAFRNIINPDVTVRSRGVMEKCTLCYQRLFDKRKGDNIKTACQEACPHGAIEFGRMATLVSIHNNLFELLGETNTQPAVLYKTERFEEHS